MSIESAPNAETIIPAELATIPDFESVRAVGACSVVVPEFLEPQPSEPNHTVELRDKVLRFLCGHCEIEDFCLRRQIRIDVAVQKNPGNPNIGPIDVIRGGMDLSERAKFTERYKKKLGVD